MPSTAVDRGRAPRRRTTGFRVAAVCACFAFTAVAGATAGGQEAPYSRMTVSSSLVQIASVGRLAPYYVPSRGVAVAVEMPAEIGRLGLSYTRFSMAPREGRDIPSFRVAVRALTWHAPRFEVGALRTSLGLRVADLDMAFADTVIVEGLRGERELLAGFDARASIPVGGPLRLRVNADVSHVFLNVPVTIAAISAGLEYSFGAPRWLTEFLR